MGIDLNRPETQPSQPSVLDYSKPDPVAISPWLRFLHVAAIAYPFLLLLSFYGTWAAAWIALGHRPRVSLDDPAQVTPHPAYLLSGIIVVLFPLGTVFGLASIVACVADRKPGKRPFAWISLLVGVWLLVFALLRWDPLSVVEWWFD